VLAFARSLRLDATASFAANAVLRSVWLESVPVIDPHADTAAPPGSGNQYVGDDTGVLFRFEACRLMYGSDEEMTRSCEL